MLKLVVSPCPNDTFIVHAWTHGLVPGTPEVELAFHDVDVANGMAQRGDADVLKISYAALPAVLRNYQLLPSGGALGRGCGPLVLARGGDTGRPLRAARVAIPGDDTTAYLLFRLWASEAPRDVVVLPFDRILPAVAAGDVDFGLVIHEARFTFREYGLKPVVDLGAWWETDTGLPIPLGAIVARRGLDADAIAAAFRASVEHAWANPQDSAAFVAAHAQELSATVQQAHIDTYVTEFSRDIGDEGRAAIRALLTRSAAAGLTAAAEPALLGF